MNIALKKWIGWGIFMCCTVAVHAQIPNDFTLIADYPLASDGVDVTSNNDGMTLVNTGFQNNAVVLNGRYIGNDATGSHARTPQLKGWTFDDFAIRVEVSVAAYPQSQDIVFAGGTGWRWMSVYVNPDSTIAFGFNNRGIVDNTTTKYTPGTFHEIIVLRTSSDNTLRVYFDGTEIHSNQHTLVHSDDANFAFEDGGVGWAFNGMARGLKFYSKGGIVPTEDPVAVPNTVTLHANYPNPFNPATAISFTVAQAQPVHLAVYDMLGREIAVLVEGRVGVGVHTVSFSAKEVPSGTYLYRLVTPQFTQTRKMLLLK